MTTKELQVGCAGSAYGDLHEHAIEHARERSQLTKKLRRKQTDMRLKALSELSLQADKQPRSQSEIDSVV